MTVAVRDIRMHCVEAGAGPPLVLIMGLGADHTAWALQVPAFAGAHRVIAFDNRGAGQTDQPDVPYTIRGMAEDTVGLLDALGIERAHVAGASLGGMIAQEVALNHPARVLTLQLHCTMARPDGSTRWLIDTWRGLRPQVSREDFTRALMPWLFAAVTFDERPEFVETIVETILANPHPQTPAAFVRQIDAVRDHDTLDRLDRIACPTLVTVGAEDILVPPRFSRVLHERIRGSRLVLIEGAGHGTFWETPQRFNAICLDFLAAHRAGAGA
jgi:pimeloyl-ACP methyl ester carboxylesterase